ncbi:MAG: DUF4423 domain-containing protein [Bdellovibrionales bacterium]|nr:DUF4423 domain-containing protein [Bdellovibrionales bacterium]
MDIFGYTEYRKAFADLFSHLKEMRGQRWSIALLAKNLGIQASYVTNVTKERAHFSADQIHMIGESIGLSNLETEFLVLLMEWERSTFLQRKKQLKKQIAEFQHRHLSSQRYVESNKLSLSDTDLQTYYLDPHIELIHLYLGLPGKSQNEKDIAGIFHLSPESVGQIIDFLQSKKLIEFQNGRWVRHRIQQHLSAESPLCQPHQQLVRFQTIEKLGRLEKQDLYTFMATVTMDEDTRLQIQAQFLKFLKKAESLVKSSKPKGIYQLQFDMFPWFKGD